MFSVLSCHHRSCARVAQCVYVHVWTQEVKDSHENLLTLRHVLGVNKTKRKKKTGIFSGDTSCLISVELGDNRRLIIIIVIIIKFKY